MIRRALLTAVFCGGVAGALCRGTLQEVWPPGNGWPWGTFTANVLGTAILAMLTITFTTQNDPNRLWRATLGAGFCGALTTFSALQIETINLARAGSPVLAVAYALASLVAGFGLAVGIAALHRARAA